MDVIWKHVHWLETRETGCDSEALVGGIRFSLGTY